MRSKFFVAYGVFNSAISGTVVAGVHMEGAALEFVDREAEWKARSKPVVYIQDFFRLFPGYEVPKLCNLNYTMAHFYKEPICVGAPDFVNETFNVPRDFCRRPEKVPHISGSQTGDDRTAFDEFLLERVLLARWQTSPLRCSQSLHDSDWCKEHADIVVVPSVELNSLETEGYTARAANRYSIHNLRRTTFVPGVHAVFWERAQEQFYQPERDYTPLVLLAQGFTSFLASAAGLATLPMDFQKRVIFLTVATETPAAHLFPATWTFAHRHLRTAEGDGGPYFLTMPHPTSIDGVADFTVSSDGYDASRQRPILISMQTGTNLTPKPAGRSGKASGALKNELLDQVERHGGFEGLLCHPSNGMSAKETCGLGSRRTIWEQTLSSSFCLEIPTASQLTKAHLYTAVLSGCVPVIFDTSLGGNYAPTNWAWRTPANESEVSEPFQAGDKVQMVSDSQALIDAFTDSRVYYHDKMEVMLGNVYTVQDSVAGNLIALPSADGSQFGTWYFPAKAVTLVKKESSFNKFNRSTPYMDYRDFAVVFDGDAVRRGEIDVVEELLRIAAVPQRMRELHEWGKRAAALFHYKKGCSDGCYDAFSNLESFMTSVSGFDVPVFPL